MEEKFIWLTMSYSLPIEPSGSRVYTWRKLRELGAESLRQGVAVLPAGTGNLQKLRALAIRIEAMEGEAVIAEMRFLDEKDNRRMVEAFKKQSRKEYTQLIDDIMHICEKSESGSSKVIHKRYMGVKSRDFFNAQNELAASAPEGRLLEGLELNLDGGWGELMSDLRQCYVDLFHREVHKDNE